MDGLDYRGQVDLMVGGSPCQAFSTNGKRGGFADTRGTLFHEFARIIDEVQPKCFIFENVKGLVMHDNGVTWATIRNTFQELNYDIYLDKDAKGKEKPLLNAKDYGVPQNRERIYLVGIRNDIKLKHSFEFPSPYSIRENECGLFRCGDRAKVLPWEEGIRVCNLSPDPRSSGLYHSKMPESQPAIQLEWRFYL
jgi:DNA-methyltransferase (dcm)